MKKKMSKKEEIEKSIAKSIEEIKREKIGIKYVTYEQLYYCEDGVEYYVPKYNHWSGSSSYASKICHNYLKKHHHIIRNKGILPHLHANHNIIELT